MWHHKNSGFFYISISLFANVSHQAKSIARRLIKVGRRGWEGREQAEAWTLLVYVAHQLTYSNVNMMSRSWSKGVNNAARPPGGSPAEIGSLTAWSLPVFLFEAWLRTKVQNGLLRSVSFFLFVSVFVYLGDCILSLSLFLSPPLSLSSQVGWGFNIHKLHEWRFLR